jgi:tRNA(fMet)-specific endonuclease VapC
MRYVFDTDHVSLLQRGHPQVISHLIRVEAADRAVTIVTAAEQLQGRLAVIRRATSEVAAVSGFRHLQETIEFYLTVRVLPYDAAAASIFEQLRAKKIRIGTQDLRIAAITLSNNATLVTRNNRDFRRVPQLSIIDWSMAG